MKSKNIIKEVARYFINDNLFINDYQAKDEKEKNEDFLSLVNYLLSGGKYATLYTNNTLNILID